MITVGDYVGGRDDQGHLIIVRRWKLLGLITVWRRRIS